MKKIFPIIFLILLSVLNVSWVKKPLKCIQPIYFFEETKKEILFTELDRIIQNENLLLDKFYPELTFLSVKYKFRLKKEEIITFNIKQFGNDSYLFMDISKNGSNFEAKIYNKIKKQAKNSYLLRDDMLCREFQKDIKSINKNKKTTLNDALYPPDTYVFDIHRYVGYDKKKYFFQTLKSKFKKTNKQEKI